MRCPGPFPACACIDDSLSLLLLSSPSACHSQQFRLCLAARLVSIINQSINRRPPGVNNQSINQSIYLSLSLSLCVLRFWRAGCEGDGRALGLQRGFDRPGGVEPRLVLSLCDFWVRARLLQSGPEGRQAFNMAIWFSSSRDLPAAIVQCRSVGESICGPSPREAFSF